MKKRRINYNEIYEEIYNLKNSIKLRLALIGIALFFFGFLFNFSLEEKLNKVMHETLSSNSSCPIIFDRSELNYLFPSFTIYKPTIIGTCFGQANNQLQLNSIKISLAFPSFYPFGLKFHVAINDGKSRVHFYPILSFFSHYIEINDSVIDGSLFAPMSSDNKSVIAGKFNINGFIKISSGVVEDGQLVIYSKNLYIPPQNIKGFEVTQLNLNTFQFDAHFANNNLMKIDQFIIGKKNSPIELKLKGTLSINSSSFTQSMLQLNGSLFLSQYMLNNFSFLKLFLPSGNTTGTYQMRIAGPLYNLGTPQFN